MAIFNKLQPFVEARAHGVHNFSSHQIMVALCAAANAPLATDGVLSDLTQIDYTYCSSRVVSRISSSQTSGIYRFIADDLLLTAVGGSVGPFRYQVLYNNSAASKNLIGFYDRGSDLTLGSGESFLIDFNGTLGVISDT